MVARLLRLRDVDDDALGAAIRRAGACLEPQEDGQAPGWLHDEYTELELRLAGDRAVGMWGAYGESGRQALHRVWQTDESTNKSATDAAGRVPGGEIGGR